MNGLSKLGVLTLVVLFMTGLYQVPVSAYTIVELGSSYLLAEDNEPQSKFTTHTTTGYVFIVSYYDGATSGYSKLSFKLINPVTSTVLDNQLVDTDSYVANSGVYAIRVITLDNDEILILGNVSASGIKAVAFRYNVNTHNIVFSISASSGASLAHYLSSDIYVYNSLYYFICLQIGTGTTSTSMTTWYFNPSDNSITKAVRTEFTCDNNFPMTKLFSYQDEDNKAVIYFITSLDNAKTFKLYSVTLSGSPAYATIATLTAFTDATTQYLTFMGSGKYTNGTDIYLHFSWVTSILSANNIRGIVIRQQRILFNNTISSGTLLDQNLKILTTYDYSGTTSLSLGFSWGYIVPTLSEYPENIRCYLPNEIAGKHVREVDAMLSDWTEFDDSTFDIIQNTEGVDNLDFTYPSELNALNAQYVIKDPTQGYSYQIFSSASTYLFTGESRLATTYDSTLTYLPVDSPLFTSKNYYFTYQIFSNDVADTNLDTYKIYVDGTVKGEGVLSSIGEASITLKVLTKGEHDLMIRIYDAESGVGVYLSDPESFTFIVPTGEDEPTPDEQSIGDITSITTFLIPAVILLFPTGMVLGVSAGRISPIISLAVGLTIGGLLGVYINAFPLYVLILIILCDIMLLVFTYRNPTSEV